MGGNQHQPDPRQSLFLQYYLDPESETFSNILQSGIKAGYSKEYSESLNYQVDWLSESIGDNYLVAKATSNLKEYLESKPEDKTDKNIKYNSTIFALDRLGGEKFRGTTKHIVQGLNITQDQAIAALKALDEGIH